MKNNTNINWSFWSIVIIILIVLVLGIVMLARTSDNNSNIISPEEIMKIQADDNTKGATDSEVVIIEYSDFQCPYCKIYSFYTNKIIEDFGDQVTVVFRHFPLESIHPNSMLAGQAAEAAGLDGKFWEMHDILFERQEEWSELSDPLPTFINYAESIGLDKDKFSVDIFSSTVKNKVERDLNSALEMNLNSTPSFFVNGLKISTPNSYDKFRKLIEAELNQNQ